ncbi:cardiolipin synthase [Ammoniphilus sp. YIM 78166]|uniref:cardiolipin synthase n=1 Tax=Ammoniphilus sp. YIM 78166 TaxID=1644106 RepID=UPI001F0EA661
MEPIFSVEHTIIFFLLPLLNFALAIFIIYMERRNISSTWVWLMVLLLLPVVGFALYMIFGQNISRERIYRLKSKGHDHRNESVDEQMAEIKRGMLLSTKYLSKYQHLISMNLVHNDSLLTQDNEVQVFTTGQDKFKVLLEQIEQAKAHVHLLYYKMASDGLGSRVLDALVRKAQEGVEVRVIYDDVGSTGLPKEFFAPLVKAGGKVFSFFPSKVSFLNGKLNFRNHRKIAVIDGRIGFVGGYNIGDEYLGLDKNIGNWRDTHLMIRGGAVQRLQSQFLLDWNVAADDVMTYDPKYFPEGEAKGNMAIQIVSSGPHSGREEIKDAFLKLIFQAKKSIYVQTPYFVPDESMLNALRIAAFSGVDVRVMIPKKPDSRIVGWASLAYLSDLVQAGVKCYLYDNGFLHAKTLVIDREVASVGSTNMDNRSFKLNFEVSAILYDQQLACQLENIFNQDMQHSVLLSQGEGRLGRVKESVGRLLSPIL